MAKKERARHVALFGREGPCAASEAKPAAAGRGAGECEGGRFGGRGAPRPRLIFSVGEIRRDQTGPRGPCFETTGKEKDGRQKIDSGWAKIDIARLAFRSPSQISVLYHPPLFPRAKLRPHSFHALVSSTASASVIRVRIFSSASVASRRDIENGQGAELRSVQLALRGGQPDTRMIDAWVAFIRPRE